MDNNNNNANKKPNKVNMPKFNLNWLYMIIAMMLLGLYITNENSTGIKSVSYDEFQQYVRDGYMSKIIGYDDNSVEAYIKPQYVKNVFQADSSKVGKNPMITTEAPSRESLGNFLQKEKDELHLFRGRTVADSAYCLPYRFLDIHVTPSERWWRRRRWRHFQCR